MLGVFPGARLQGLMCISLAGEQRPPSPPAVHPAVHLASPGLAASPSPSTPPSPPPRSYDPRLQEVKAERCEVEARIAQLAGEAARDLGLVLDKTIKLEWHKVANTRTR
jgi:hypothetical protein